MNSRMLAAIIAASLLSAQLMPSAALADNPMGYRLLTAQDASRLPQNQGALGLDVKRVQQITDGGMTFDIIGVTHVRPGSAGALAGFKVGDEIIALDGQVFPTLVAFATYIGSSTPGSQITVDYMPAGHGPQQAQRVAVTVGRAGQAPAPDRQAEAERPAGMSTGTKIAIGAGAVALLGCYEMGCFSHRAKPTGGQQPSQQPDSHQPGWQQPVQQPNGQQLGGQQQR